MRQAEVNETGRGKHDRESQTSQGEANATGKGKHDMDT